MTRTDWQALYVSVALHAVFLLLPTCSQDRRDRALGDDPNGDRKDGDVAGIHMNIIDHMPPMVRTPSDKCKTWFGGIGITYAGTTVAHVFHGYPAEKNGLIDGDMIPQMGTLIGEVGSDIEFDVLRGTKAFHVKTKRAKICTGD